MNCLKINSQPGYPVDDLLRWRTWSKTTLALIFAKLILKFLNQVYLKCNHLLEKFYSNFKPYSIFRPAPKTFQLLSFVWSVSTSKLGPFWYTSAFPQLIFSSQICSPLPPLSEIKERVKDSLTKFRQDHLRALNPTPYKVRQIFLKQARVPEMRECLVSSCCAVSDRPAGGRGFKNYWNNWRECVAFVMPFANG